MSRLPCLKKHRKLMTIALCSVICLSQFQHGVEVGYLNFAVEDINSPSEKNPFHINKDQQSWLTSVAMFGSMAGVILSAPLLSKLERQEVVLASCLPSAIGWLTITCAGSVNTMYAGRIIVGLAQGLAGGAAFIFLIEIARPDIRGAISLFSMMGVALGKLFVYVIGDLIAWNWTSLIMIGLTLVVTVGLSSIPEDPKLIMLQENKEAMQANNETVELENNPGCSTDDSFSGSDLGEENAIDGGSVLTTIGGTEPIMSGTLNKVEGIPLNSEAGLVSDNFNMGNYEIEETLQQISCDTSVHLGTEDASKLETPADAVLNSGVDRSIKSAIIGKLKKVTGSSLNSKIVNVLNTENDNVLNEGFSDAFKSTSNSISDDVLNSGAGNESNLATESVLKSRIGGPLKSLIGDVVNKVGSGPFNLQTTNFPNSEDSNALNLISNSAAESIGNVKSKGEQNSALGSVLFSKAENSLNSGVENTENLDLGSASSINSEVGSTINIENANSLNCEIDDAVKSVTGNTLKSGIGGVLNLKIRTTLNPGTSSSLKAKIGSDINLEKEGEKVLNSVVARSALNSLAGGALNSLAKSALSSATGSDSVIGKALNFNSEPSNNSMNGTGVISTSVTGDDAIDFTPDAGLNSLTSMATNEVNEFTNQTVNNITGEVLNSIPGSETVSDFVETAANSLIGRGINTIVEKVKQVDDKYTGGKIQVVAGEVVKALKKVGPNKVLQLVQGKENEGHNQTEIDAKLQMIKEPVPWKDLFRGQKDIAKYLGCCVFLQMVSTMGGVVVLNQYSVTIFKLSRTNLSENTQSLLLAVIGVVFTIVCSLTIDLMSRKRVALISLLCEGFFMITLGIYFYIDDYVDHAWAQKYIFWLPLVSFIMFQIFLIWSDATIFLVSAELFSTEIRGRVSPILLTFRQLFLFFGAKGFLKLIELIKLCGGFWVCAAIDVAGGVFYVFLVPETSKKFQSPGELNQESSEV